MTAVYHIGVQGHLDVDWSEEFEGLTIIHQSDGSSLLCGVLADQSVLHALLLKVRDLGLPLLSLSRIEREKPDHSS
ncbi:MAG: hypothetical protein NVSMB27_41990 [Ktedonobacteraceae bacterium]